MFRRVCYSNILGLDDDDLDKGYTLYAEDGSSTNNIFYSGEVLTVENDLKPLYFGNGNNTVYFLKGDFSDKWYTINGLDYANLNGVWDGLKHLLILIWILLLHRLLITQVN